MILGVKKLPEGYKPSEQMMAAILSVILDVSLSVVLSQLFSYWLELYH